MRVLPVRRCDRLANTCVPAVVKDIQPICSNTCFTDGDTLGFAYDMTLSILFLCGTFALVRALELPFRPPILWAGGGVR